MSAERQVAGPKGWLLLAGFLLLILAMLWLEAQRYKASLTAPRVVNTRSTKGALQPHPLPFPLA